ncbi:RND transporter [Megasphaera cerevisiae DSM 20462]|jgi:membrane fusion protein (multidrug efflux system)|uniref:RND transporter n=1 Tax=Megasphaera cerevisiae DSM 20462 TaxID=1122219 RepID=A0A0J6WV32_9FIRM|nr:efflux RND transporter periplasmic adaptor subunit [Megasphaera cerevisiae]KMO87405.1 RND transporter [Megasphaera cerevisiae DSM 20462]MCI1749865.1 efflux RND transporter periplasmic adaptor subunit [Megasphaera cerevisiae]OKY54795.1 efflux transporter periplasmic adaptor subunit [Megasphaera cerevisiae]SJZ38344.1 membrane fusion protein, multidrug efflux system [Megasphaera cerevisiae DSM 20462]
MIQKHKFFTMGITVLTIAALLAGCGAQKGATKAAVSVNTYKVTAEDTPVTAEYSGSVTATDKVPVRPKISGRVIEKYVQGGQEVTAGQPLFRLDSREYDAALQSAQANKAEAAANLANQQLNLRRYQILAGQDAIAEQTVTNQESATQQQQAVLDANAAQVQSAQDNVDDTIVYAPFSGKLNVDDVPIGTYATAGSTALVTISSTNPVFVEFSVSEAEYLQMTKKTPNSPGSWGDHLQLRLSDGSMYPYEGHVTQINHGMDSNSGSITVKAVFDNPDNLLIPGLYATVVSDTQIQQHALLVPQRAVQQTLGKYFVSVVNENGEAQTKEVKPGQKVGKFWIINEGLADGDVIIVDGYQKATGATLDQHLLTKADIENDSTADTKSK